MFRHEDKLGSYTEVLDWAEKETGSWRKRMEERPRGAGSEGGVRRQADKLLELGEEAHPRLPHLWKTQMAIF